MAYFLVFFSISTVQYHSHGWLWFPFKTIILKVCQNKNCALILHIQKRISKSLPQKSRQCSPQCCRRKNQVRHLQRLGLSWHQCGKASCLTQLIAIAHLLVSLLPPYFLVSLLSTVTNRAVLLNIMRWCKSFAQSPSVAPSITQSKS